MVTPSEMPCHNYVCMEGDNNNLHPFWIVCCWHRLDCWCCINHYQIRSETGILKIGILKIKDWKFSQLVMYRVKKKIMVSL